MQANFSVGRPSASALFTGEMERHSGSVRMGGSLAYVAQQAWIVNDSLQSNVLFGQELSEQRWEACVHACSLQQDLEVSLKPSKPAFGIRTTEAVQLPALCHPGCLRCLRKLLRCVTAPLRRWCYFAEHSHA